MEIRLEAYRSDVAVESVTLTKEIDYEHSHAILTFFLSALHTLGYHWVDSLSATSDDGHVVSTNDWIEQ